MLELRHEESSSSNRSFLYYTNYTNYTDYGAVRPPAQAVGLALGPGRSRAVCCWCSSTLLRATCSATP